MDLHIRDDDQPDPVEEANQPTEPWPVGHTELAGVQVQPLTEGEPWE